MVQTALEIIVEHKEVPGVFSKMSSKVQASNYVRYMSDIRAVKRATVTGARLDGFMKQLIDAMRFNDSFSFA